MCLQWPQDGNWKNTHNQHPSIGDIWALKSWTNLCTKPLSLSKLTQLSAQYLDWHLMKHAWDAWNMTEKSLTRTEVNVRSDICLRPALNRHEAQLQKKWLQKQDHPWKLFRSGLSSATDAQTRKNIPKLAPSSRTPLPNPPASPIFIWRSQLTSPTDSQFFTGPNPHLGSVMCNCHVQARP